MTIEFEELDYQETALGSISLRRRCEPMLPGKIVYEVKLGDEFLMSSLFTDSEMELARLGLAALETADVDVVIGGLGLGYTAIAVLKDPTVRSLTVVELLEPVIDWHRRGLVPLGRKLLSDARCSVVRGDFFDLVASSSGGFEDTVPTRHVHAVLLDIDHSPSHWLDATHASFYTTSGLRNLADKLHPGGVFALWSNDPPHGDFTRLLETIFQSPETHVVSFRNPYSGGEASSTVYLARKRRVEA